MKVIKEINDIDVTLPEGRYLLAALSILTVSADLQILKQTINGRTLTPGEMIDQVGQVVEKMYEGETMETRQLVEAPAVADFRRFMTSMREQGIFIPTWLLDMEESLGDQITEVPYEKTEAVEEAEKQAAFLYAARPLIKYLAEDHHPHMTVIVTNTGAELLEAQRNTGEITTYIRD